MRAHPIFQSLETSEGHVAIENAGAASDGLGREEQAVVQFGVLENEGSHNEVRVASDVLGARVIDDIRAEVEGSL